ncbi:proteasome regulatory particle base subunit [Entomophthora muscae]|uniref:Proteasome regulatory particle base subunit n=1 Tax=Entomophthora muscae TaxID=34485 RepID=A0ACC2SKA8_9FUNG|nr:proteasome regulatory particle base subunit [Entomophthora muscae]
MATALTSVAGLLSLLDEEKAEIQVFALNNLNELIDQFWAEVSESIAKIEVLYEDEVFEHRQLAALLASKVYYHLGEYEESLTFALGAKDLFNPAETSEYSTTIISKAIDRYILNKSQGKDVDDRLEGIVEGMFRRCFEEKEYKQALGIALESHRLDIVKKAILEGETTHLLEYVLKVSLTLTQNAEFRLETIRLVRELYRGLETPNHFWVVQCNVYLNEPQACYQLLRDLSKLHGKPEDYLTALQICFDLENSASQEFITILLELFPESNQGEKVVESDEHFRLCRLRSILKGEQSIRFYLEFLSRNNNTDLAILRNTKSSLDSRNSLFHSAVTFANAFMHCGTTSDKFLRMNLEWLSRASNWSKFSATAALGVIHKGNIENSRTILTPYLPNETNPGSPYSEGGSLFAMGLIHANHCSPELDFILRALQSSQNEVIQHGAALGLGAGAMASNNEVYYEELKKVLFTDSAIAGEAAGIAMGLVKLGTASQPAIDEMLRYAQETQHEKIIRGLALGIALIMYGTESAAEPLIASLMADKDPILRFGAMYTIAMAYCGTGSNDAIRRLLHVAVSDTSDDVRRAAVTALGFILFKTPKQVPRVVQLLSESYNPHVRYGATLALGISCAGTGLTEAIDILEPMVKDPTDYVRQGALIALAMILCQHNDASSPRSSAIRKLFESIITDKHEDSVAKFGAALGQGLIDAGGRNSTISLQNQMGLTNMAAVAGMVVFTQFWFWFPLTHFISLCFTPTTLIGITDDLKIPDFKLTSRARPSLFAYPPKLKAPQASVVEKVATAVLSTTAKAKARAKKRREAAGAEGNDTAEPMEEDKEPLPQVAEPAQLKREPEPTSEEISNMQRVLPGQLQHIEFYIDGRYFPLKQNIVGGIVVLVDQHPDQEHVVLFPQPPPADAPASGTATEENVVEPTPTPQSQDKPQAPGGFDYQFD